MSVDGASGVTGEPMDSAPMDSTPGNQRAPVVARVLDESYPSQWASFQFWILLLASFLVAMAFLLHRPVAADGVELADADETLQLLGAPLPLPEICLVRRMFGVACPGCGLTRSVVATARGQFSRAMAHHPAGPIIFFWAVAQIPYRLGNLWRLRMGKSAWKVPGALVMLGLISLVCIGQWIVRSTIWF